MVYPYKSAMKRNRVLTHAAARINLTNMLNERNHIHVTQFHLYEISRIGKSTEIETRLIVWGWGKGEWKKTANGCGVTIQRDEKVLEIVMMDTQHCEYIHCNCTVCFKAVKMVNLTCILPQLKKKI